MAVRVNEVTVIKPDLLRVEVFDSDVTLQGIEEYDGSAFSYFEPSSTWSDINSKKGFPIGPNKDWVFYEDLEPDAYLDRDAAQVAGNYGAIGGKTVTAVYYKAKPRRGFEQFPGNATRGSQMRHYLYLELSADLAEGDHTIDFPSGTGLADYSFTYDTHTTRCSAIHVNQHGYRPSDVKYAHLSQWVPGYGTNGEIDLVSELSLTAFQIIDEDGNQVYSGSIEARVGPTDAEASYNISDTATATSNRQRYVDSTENAVSIAAITTGSSTTIEYSGADVFSNGDIIALDAIPDGSLYYLLNQQFVSYVKVASVNTTNNTFVVKTLADADIDTTGGSYTSGGLIFKTWLSNSVGTYVYGMDFSAFSPSVGGTFRIRIPGLGVSDTFKVDDAVWYKAASMYAQGEYSQRMGIEIDGRFGFTRPLNFRSGYNNQTIYESTVPYFFCSESGIAPNDIDQQAAGAAPYLTSTEVTGWGGWHDAGDWDSRLPVVLEPLHLMLVVYENMTSAQRTGLDFGLPLSSEIFGAGWSAIDGEGDLLHSALWCVESYRQLQKSNGSVPAGFNISTGEPFGEPSWLYRFSIYEYLPDEGTTFGYALVAAKLAKVLEDLGYTTLATTYETSAVDAWDWAESIYQNTAGARDDHYAQTETDMVTAGFSSAEFDANVAASVANAASNRRIAAAALFALTGESTYKTIIDTDWGGGAWSMNGGGKMAAYEYSQAAGANSTYAAQMETAIATWSTTGVINHASLDIGYKHVAVSGQGNSFGRYAGSQIETVSAMILAHLVGGSSTHKDALVHTMNYILGSNQTEYCWTSGLGHRNTLGMLHRDVVATAQDFPNGYNIYGPNRQEVGQAAFNFQTGDTQFINWVGSIGTSPDENHVPQPHRLAWPINEALWENRLVIEQMEYTTQEGILPQYAGSVYLHALNDNTATEYDTYGGADMLVTTSANAIVTDGSIEQATSIEAGVRVSWRGLTLDLDAATYTVTPVI